ERPQQDPLIVEDELPGGGPDDERHEERQQDQEQVGRLAGAAVERDPVGHRVGQDQAERGHDQGEDDRADELGGVELPGPGVVRPLPGEPEAGLDVAALQRQREHHQQRQREEDGQPQSARQPDQVGGEPGAAGGGGYGSG